MDRFLRVLGVLVLIAAALIAVLVVWHRPVLNAAGRWLVVQDPLARADVIVVLSGGVSDDRVRQSASLYRQGYAPRVLLSGGDGTGGGVPDAELMRRQALRAGIPASAMLFETESTSTAEQAQLLRPQLEHLGVRRAIVVTSSYHTRRAGFIFRRAFRGSPVEISVYPVQNDVYNPTEWWTREEDAERAGLEFVKLFLALFR